MTIYKFVSISRITNEYIFINGPGEVVSVRYIDNDNLECKNDTKKIVRVTQRDKHSA